MNRLGSVGIGLLTIIILVSCNRQPAHVVSVTTEAIPVDASLDEIQDSAYLQALAPIKARMEAEMNVVLGFAAEEMWVGAPECPMLNWATDALWEAAKKIYDGKVDMAIANMGGMRCAWNKGPITRGNVFELMPFDNRLVVLTLTGNDILELCESFVRYGGQGVAGLRMTAIDGHLGDVTINGKAVNPKGTYHVATSDYLSGGADHMDALTHYTEYWNSDLLIRDLYIEAVQQDTIRAGVDGRMRIL